MPKIEMSKQYRTRDGRPVRILCVDAKHHHYPVVGLQADGDNEETTGRWTIDGTYYYSTLTNKKCDLIEVRPRIKRTVWANVYKRGHVESSSYVSAYADKITADKNATFNRIACIPIEIDCEEGEGLDT